MITGASRPAPKKLTEGFVMLWSPGRIAARDQQIHRILRPNLSNWVLCHCGRPGRDRDCRLVGPSLLDVWLAGGLVVTIVGIVTVANRDGGYERALRWSGADVLLPSCGACVRPPT